MGLNVSTAVVLTVSVPWDHVRNAHLKPLLRPTELDARCWGPEIRVLTRCSDACSIENYFSKASPQFSFLWKSKVGKVLDKIISRCLPLPTFYDSVTIIKMITRYKAKGMCVHPCGM